MSEPTFARHPDDGHSHYFACLRCGVDPAQPAEPRWPSGPDAATESRLPAARQLLHMTKVAGGPDMVSEHPEATCERCGRPNVSWSAPSPLWNAVMRDPVTKDDRYSVVCPICFAQMAIAKGIAGTRHWMFYADMIPDLAALWPAEPGYIWDDEKWLWVERDPGE